MKKATYIQPIVKVVQFQVESGFNASRLGHSFLTGRRDDFATGEHFTEYTDESGEYSIGRWE